jgi:uncharacterized protein (DUF433 family)
MTTGTGIFTPREAGLLLHEDTATVRRWAFGYARTREAGRKAHPPLIRTELPVLEGERALTFVELVELLYVRAFQRADVTWPAIREAARVAARLYGTEHPFALRQVFVDPEGVYGTLAEADGSESLVQLKGHGQHAMPALVKPYLEQIDFDADDVACRWWPMGRGGGVVVDPLMAFGSPIVEEAGIRTRTLADAVDAERPAFGDGAVKRVAWTYEIEPAHVETALRFREWLRAA